MTPEDAPLTVDWMVGQYGFDRREVEGWVRNLHFNWPLSVKALGTQASRLHAAGTASYPVVGLLNMSDYRIEEETAQMADEKPQLLHRLNAMRYTAVFSFIVAEEYRHTRLNYDMVMSLMTERRS